MFSLRSSPYALRFASWPKSAGRHQQFSLVFSNPWVIIGIVISRAPSYGMRGVLEKDGTPFPLTFPGDGPVSTGLGEYNRVSGIDSHLIHALRNLILSFADLPVSGQLDIDFVATRNTGCLLYTSPSPRDSDTSRMPSSA